MLYANVVTTKKLFYQSMKDILIKHWRTVSTVLFGVAIFLFWRIGYPQVISFNEELQLFVFDTDYLQTFFEYPGGIAAYIGTFLTQFYASLTVGAIILALISVVLQQLTWHLIRLDNSANYMYVLSFVPSVLLLHVMGDESVLLAMPIGTLLVLLACLGYVRIRHEEWQWCVAIVGIPLLFYAVGVCAYMFVFYVIFKAIQKYGISARCISLSVLALLTLCTTIVACYRIFVYPLDRIAAGMINMYRFKDAFVSDIALFCFVTALMPCIATLSKGVKDVVRVSVVATIALVAGFIVAATLRFSEVKFTIMRHDMLMRTHSWADVIELAKKNEPCSPLEVYSVNFALAMLGELPDRMFEFPQHSPQGLLPTYRKELSYLLMSNEVYFRLGLVNAAQRFVFEAQESIPNKQRSGRMMRRLAEISIINGEYAVAERYLRILQKTFAYSKWATEMLGYLGNEEKINAHPLYSELRSLRIKNDFFFSDDEADQMLGLLFMHNKENRMALDYLLCYELLLRDTKHFAEYYNLTKNLPTYNRIPRVYQEALAYIWAQNHKSFDGIRWNISAQVKRDFSAFVTALKTKNEIIDQSPMKDTYWYYFLDKE